MTDKVKKIFLYGGLLAGIALVIGIIISATAPTLKIIATEISASDHILGTTEPKITMIEYSDFQCPACKQYGAVVREVVAEFENHIMFTYRSFPLRKIHSNAMISAQAAQAAGLQGKFWEMHDVLFISQEIWSPMTQEQATETFKQYAKELGLDVEKFAKDISSNEVLEKIAADEKSANAAGLDHTPTFFLNGKEINNPRSLDEFRKVIREELAKINK